MSNVNVYIFHFIYSQPSDYDTNIWFEGTVRRKIWTLITLICRLSLREHWVVFFSM